MLKQYHPLIQRRNPRPKRVPPRLAIESLALVSATYDQGTSVTLTFNQAIDVSGMDPDEFSVVDGVYASARFSPVGMPVMVGANAVRIELEQVDTYFDADILLNAGAGNGIVAVVGGAPWSGVTDYEIPTE